MIYFIVKNNIIIKIRNNIEYKIFGGVYLIFLDYFLFRTMFEIFVLKEWYRGQIYMMCLDLYFSYWRKIWCKKYLYRYIYIYVKIYINNNVCMYMYVFMYICIFILN